MDKECLMINPLLVLREEFDDWGLLFDPETGNAYGLNPVGVFVWKRLDGYHEVADIMAALEASCHNIPANAETYVTYFIDDLIERGFVGHEFY
jgi:SynChlorMet cassette protein ScmD